MGEGWPAPPAESSPDTVRDGLGYLSADDLDASPRLTTNATPTSPTSREVSSSFEVAERGPARAGGMVCECSGPPLLLVMELPRDATRLRGPLHGEEA